MSFSNMLGGAATFFEAVSYYLVELLHFFSYLLYKLISVISRVCIWFPEFLFKSLCGIGETWTYGGDGGEAIGTSNGVTTDIVLAFIRNKAVQDTFWAILGFSVVLLFILTLIAVVRSEFTLDPTKAAKGPIIGRALRGFANFLLVPVLSIAFIYGANLAVRAVYSLTSGESKTIATKIFEITTHGANRARLEKDPSGEYGEGSFAHYLVYNGNGILAEGEGNTGDRLSYISSGSLFPQGFSDTSKVADIIDNYLFSVDISKIREGSTTSADGTNIQSNLNTRIDEVVFKTAPVKKFTDALETQQARGDAYYIPWQTFLVKLPESMKGIDYAMFNDKLVNFFYNPSEMNLILGIGAALIVGWNMLGIIILLLKRAFELVILFVISPVVVSLYPLDDGAATCNCRKQFMNRVLSPTVIVFAYNIFFMLLKLMDKDNLSFFTNNNILTNNFILKLFFDILVLIVATSLLKSASKTLCDILGVEDMIGGSGDAMKKAWGTATGAARTTVATLAMPGRMVGAARRAGNKVFNGLKDAGNAFNNLDSAEVQEEKQEAYEKAKADYKDKNKVFKSLNVKLLDENLSDEERANLEAQRDEAKEDLDAAKATKLSKQNEYKSSRAQVHDFMGDVLTFKHVRGASTSAYEGQKSRLGNQMKSIDSQIAGLEDKDDAESVAKRESLMSQKAELQKEIDRNEAVHKKNVRRGRHLGFFGLDTSVDNEKIHQKPLGEVGQSLLDILGSGAENNGASDIIKFATDSKARASAITPASIMADRTAKEDREKEKKKNKEYLEEQAKISREQSEKQQQAQEKAEAARRAAEMGEKREREMPNYVDAAIRGDKDLYASYTTLQNSLQSARDLYGDDDNEEVKNIQANIENFKANVEKNQAQDLFNQANRVDNKNRRDDSITDEMAREARKKLADFQNELEEKARADAREENANAMKEALEGLKQLLTSSEGKLGGMTSEQMDALAKKLGDQMEKAVKSGTIAANKEAKTNFNKFKISGEMGELIKQIKNLHDSTTTNNEDITAILELLKGLEDRINSNK